MLKINKILSKKIKSPLSLRAILLCHSRESGNPFTLSLREALSPVIARERSNRSNLNLKGFSLIELMIAVVILALAIVGIFHAYSVGFMGMADSRDRTVATNIAQEKMESIKNIPFSDIDNYIINNNGSTKEISGKIFTINIESEAYEGNEDLKEITIKVSWDSDGKEVELKTLIYNNN